MVDALADVRKSLARIAESGKSGPAFSLLDRLKGFIDRGVAEQQALFPACEFTRLKSAKWWRS